MPHRTIRVEICDQSSLAQRRAKLRARRFDIILAEQASGSIIVCGKDDVDDPLGAGWVLVGVK